MRRQTVTWLAAVMFTSTMAAARGAENATALPRGCSASAHERGADAAVLATLRSARRIVVINDTGLDLPAVRRALRATVSRHGEWLEVSDRQGADLVIVLNEIHGEGGRSISVAIRTPISDAVLWTASGHSITEALRPFGLHGTPGDLPCIGPPPSTIASSGQ
ncbi:MAG TPA: hypothetical protein VG871_04870 [Vicinamibacterales bacterium]|nr:hypothetical protein [Vicinamibacterales bacterium]